MWPGLWPGLWPGCGLVVAWECAPNTKNTHSVCQASMATRDGGLLGVFFPAVVVCGCWLAVTLVCLVAHWGARLLLLASCLSLLRAVWFDFAAFGLVWLGLRNFRCYCCWPCWAMPPPIPRTGGGKKSATIASEYQLPHSGSSFATVSLPRRPVLNVGAYRFTTRRDLVALFFRFDCPSFRLSTLKSGAWGVMRIMRFVF